MQLSTLIAGLMAAAPLVAADCFNIVCASEPYLYVPNYATCPTNLVPVVPAKGVNMMSYYTGGLADGSGVTDGPGVEAYKPYTVVNSTTCMNNAFAASKSPGNNQQQLFFFQGTGIAYCDFYGSTTCSGTAAYRTNTTTTKIFNSYWFHGPASPISTAYGIKCTLK